MARIAETEPGGTATAPAAGATEAGLVARIAVAMALAAAVAILPAVVGPIGDGRITAMAVFGMFGLSMNVLIGYLGQASLGQQGIAGVGAFASAWIATHARGVGFFVALPAAALTGALVASVLGLAGMRVRGLRLAVLTFAFGIVAESTIFRWGPLAPTAAGLPAPKPAAFTTPRSYAYLCVAVLAFFTWCDWRISRSKAGRAMLAVRHDERIAAALGIDVLGTKILAFATSGFLAGAGGALLAHWRGAARPADFTVLIALTWVLMTVAGGPGSRAGVLASSAFFGLLPLLLPTRAVDVPLLGPRSVLLLSPLLAAVLTLLTLTLYPGGLGRQLLPIRRWLAGGALVEPRPAVRVAGAISAEPAERDAAPVAKGSERAPFAWEITSPPGMTEGEGAEVVPGARPGGWTVRRRARTGRRPRHRRGALPTDGGS